MSEDVRWRSRYVQLARRNVVHIDDERHVRLGQVNEEATEDGSADLEVVFPDGRAVQLDFLLVLPNIYRKLAEAFLEWGKTASVDSLATKYTLAYNLKAFAEYLSQSGFADITFGELTTSHIKGFVAWLDDQPNRGRSWCEDTRRDKLGAVRTLLEHVRKMFPNELQASFHVPNGMWVGIAQKANPTPALDQFEWSKLLQACLSEVTEAMDHYAQCQSLIDAGQGRVPHRPAKRTPYTDPAVFAASLHAAYPGVIPDLKTIRSDNLPLANSLQYVHGGAFVRGLYPFGRELAPFVLLLGIYTLFNATPLLNLERANIRYREVLGQRRLLIEGYKARSDQRVSRSFAEDPNDKLSPGEIIKFLDRWTARIRPFVPVGMRDRLFLFVPNNGKAEPRGFFDKLGATNDRVWKFSVRQFFERHGIEASGLRNVRQTGLDVIHSLFSGDVRAVAAAGGQRSLDVLDRHYKSSAAAQRNDEALSGVMATRERFAQDGGLHDPRGSPAPSDIYAATPGAICLDPYDSPVPGQKTGQLCGAYGICWICPLSQLALRSSYQLARAYQFRQELLEARGYLSPGRWHQRWRPVLSRLDSVVLPAFTDPDVIERARVLVPRLPRLPKLD